MTKQFNVVDECWCPVRLPDGRVTMMGLRELFQRSGEISALAETAPPNLIAQYRLLLAVTHRALTLALGHWTVKDRARWFRDGLPVDVICEYLQKWHERFWLFHPERPFMQVAALASADETRDKLKPWTQIDLASASGNTPVVFDHACDILPTTISAAQAVSTLLGFLQFTPGGLVKCLRDADKAGALVNTAAVLPAGETLAHTLCLALHASPRTGSVADLPCWERDAPTIAALCAEPQLASGANDRYTRLSRAVLLRREPGGGIRHLHFAAGLALADDPHAPDPMACFRTGSVGPVRLTFSEGRALWRDLPALVADSGDGGRIAAVIAQAIALHKELAPFDVPYQPLLVAGLASDQAKLLRWRVEQFSLPSVLLLQADKARELQARVAAADALHSELKRLGTSMLAATLPTSSSKDTRVRARAMLDAGPLTATYFARAEQTLPALLQAVAEGRPEHTDRLWNDTLRLAAEASWQSLLTGLGNSSVALRADALYWPRFCAVLNKLAPRSEQTFTEKEYQL